MEEENALTLFMKLLSLPEKEQEAFFKLAHDKIPRVYHTARFTYWENKVFDRSNPDAKY